MYKVQFELTSLENDTLLSCLCQADFCINYLFIVTTGLDKRIPPGINDFAAAYKYSATLPTDTIHRHKMYLVLISPGVDYILSNLSPTVRPIWDPCNELFADNGEPPYPDGYNHIKQDIIHVHLKDGVKDTPDGPVCVPMCEGDIDYRGQLAALIEDGYTGCLSLETHWRPKPDQIDKELLDRPGGQEFSDLGEEASRICLENTLQLLRDIGVERQ